MLYKKGCRTSKSFKFFYKIFVFEKALPKSSFKTATLGIDKSLYK